MNNIFLLIFFITVGIHTCKSAVTEGYCRRVKRSPNLMVEATKSIGSNVTTTTSTSKPATMEKNKHVTNATVKPQREADKEIATKIRSAIEKFKLKTPAAVHVRHVKLNRTEPATLRELRRNMEKERCTDIRHPKSLLLLKPRTAEENFDDEQSKDNEKFFEFLTGKQAGESKHHHERYGRAFFVKDNAGKKAKRNAAKSSIHHKIHKETKDHKHKRSDSDSPIDNFMRLTKMLVEMSGNVRPESSLHAHSNDAESLSPIAGERLTEVIYKPLTVESASGGDDVALISSNEYLSNEFASVPQPQHAILPLEGGTAYHEFTLPLITSFSPMKFLTNAVESGIALSSDKDDSDSDEYEMTCPVHFKRSTDAANAKDGNGGVIELCTCHLYRKKKQVL